MASILEQFKYYKQYEELSNQAKQTFDTSFYTQSFMDLLERTYQNGDSLDDLQFALNTFDNLKTANNIEYATTLQDLRLQPQFNSVDATATTSTTSISN